MSEDRSIYCERCGSFAEAGDRFCGVCGARITPNAPGVATREVPNQVQPPQDGTEAQVASIHNNRVFAVAGVVGVALLLLVGGGALAFAGLVSSTGLLGGTNPKPMPPASTWETTTSLPEPTRERTWSPIESTEPKVVSPGSTVPDAKKVLEAEVRSAAQDYYLAAGAEEWDHTYDNLDSQTQSMFTEKEWFRKNQWFWDRNPTVYHILSIEPDSESEDGVAEVELRITGEDDSSWIRTTYFVKESGEWLHRFSDEEMDLFMPNVAFEQFVEAQTGSSLEETPAPVADGTCETLPGESQDPDCVDDQQDQETGLLRFDGSWRVHGTQMNIVSDATSSQIANVGPCTDPFGPYASDVMCNQVLLIEFEEDPSGGIIGTITEIRHETWEGDAPPPSFEPGSDVEVGDSFKLEFVDDNLLYTTWLGEAADLNGQGNPYWCNSQTSEENTPKCGA